VISINGFTPGAIEKISHEEIIIAIQQLSPAYRTVTNLFIIEGYSHEEIAGMLDISVGTSKSNLWKARQQLQKIIIKQHEILIEKHVV
jgi:RNA polymerase sigma-70 factor (ECF subfamily)